MPCLINSSASFEHANEASGSSSLWRSVRSRTSTSLMNSASSATPFDSPTNARILDTLDSSTGSYYPQQDACTQNIRAAERILDGRIENISTDGFHSGCVPLDDMYGQNYDEFDEFFDDLPSSDAVNAEAEKEKILAQLFAVPPFPVGIVFQPRHQARCEQETLEDKPEFDSIITQVLVGDPLPKDWQGRKRFRIPSRVKGILELETREIDQADVHRQQVNSGEATDADVPEVLQVSDSKSSQKVSIPQSLNQSLPGFISAARVSSCKDDHRLTNSHVSHADQSRTILTTPKDREQRTEELSTRSDRKTDPETGSPFESYGIAKSLGSVPLERSSSRRLCVEESVEEGETNRKAVEKVSLPVKRILPSGVLTSSSSTKSHADESSDSEPEALFASNSMQAIRDQRTRRTQQQPYVDSPSVVTEDLRDGYSRSRPIQKMLSPTSEDATSTKVNVDKYTASGSDKVVSDTRSGSQNEGEQSAVDRRPARLMSSKQTEKSVGATQAAQEQVSAVPSSEKSDRPVAATGYWEDVRRESIAARKITDAEVYKYAAVMDSVSNAKGTHRDQSIVDQPRSPGNLTGDSFLKTNDRDRLKISERSISSLANSPTWLRPSVQVKQRSTKPVSSSRSATPQTTSQKIQPQTALEKPDNPSPSPVPHQPEPNVTETPARIARKLPFVPGRGRKLFSIQITEVDKTHEFPVYEFDVPGVIANEVRLKFEPTNPGLSDAWTTKIEEMYRKKREKLKRKDDKASSELLD